MSFYGNTKRPGIEDTLAWLREQSHDVLSQPTLPAQRSALSTHLNRLAKLTHGGIATHPIDGESEKTSVSDLVAILRRLATKAG